MELLDSTIALVVTLAALATTVTVLMEIWVRIFGLKNRGQIELFTKLFNKAVKGKFPGQQDAWSFINKTLGNPLSAREIRKPRGWEKLEKDQAKLSCREFSWGRGKGVYEWVSHEHVFRRLLEMEGAVNATKADLIARLKRFSKKYDEYCAAASVEFKDSRRLLVERGDV